jgi:hypothetical protein
MPLPRLTPMLENPALADRAIADRKTRPGGTYIPPGNCYKFHVLDDRKSGNSPHRAIHSEHPDADQRTNPKRSSQSLPSSWAYCSCWACVPCGSGLVAPPMMVSLVASSDVVTVQYTLPLSADTVG